MKQIIVTYGQSIFDLAIMHYGNVTDVWKIIDDNRLSDGLDTDFAGGETILVRTTETSNVISEYFKRFSVVVNNSDLDQVNGVVNNLSIILLEIGNENFGGDGYILIDVTGGVGPYAFEWKDQETEAVISNLQNLVGSQSGTYKVKVTDSQGIEIELFNLIISVADTNVYLTDDFGNYILDDNGTPISGQ